MDASTPRATVAVIRGTTVVAETEVAERSEHVEPLLPAALALLAEAAIPLSALEAIVCGAGPGGFTGLRTAASIAKGMCSGLSIPLYAVPSLALIVAGARTVPPPSPGGYLAVLDAGRDERFVSRVPAGDEMTVDPPQLVAAAAIPELAARLGARVIGPATGAWPHVRGVARLDWGAPVDLASWEPDYGRRSAAEDRRRAQAAI